MTYRTHLFICTNSPQNLNKCGSKGAEELRQKVKAACQEKYGKEIRINASGCLGHCEKGIAAVAYPKGQWLFELNKLDEEKLMTLVQDSLE